MADESKKSYPVRNRITPQAALANIHNWLDKESQEESDEFSDSDLSEESDEDYQLPPATATTVVATPSESTQTESVDNDEPGPSVIKKKRGRPSGQGKSAKKKSKNSTHQADSGDDDDDGDMKWHEIVAGEEDFRHHEFRFIPHRDPGVHANLNGDSSAYDCFVELFTDEVQEELVELINEFAAYKVQQNNPATEHSRYNDWKPVTRYELLKLLAVLISMGITRKPSLCDYWAMDDTNYTPWYHELFSRNRFQMIFSTMLHAGSVGDERSKTSKIEPFMNSLLLNFQEAFYPDKNLSIDEMVVKWKGRSKYKMYNPCKPEKYHIKTFGVCDSATGYAYNLLIYFGKETSFNQELQGGQSEKVFEYLLRPLGPGHHVFADRYYTTYSLITYLSAKNTYYTGTLQSNRKNFPDEIKTAKIAHLECKFYRSEKNMGPMVCLWKDKKARKPVIIVSTHETKRKAKQKF